MPSVAGGARIANAATELRRTAPPPGDRGRERGFMLARGWLRFPAPWTRDSSLARGVPSEERALIGACGTCLGSAGHAKAVRL